MEIRDLTPIVDGQRGGAAHKGQLERLVAAGDRGGAVKYFMKDMVGRPPRSSC